MCSFGSGCGDSKRRNHQQYGRGDRRESGDFIGVWEWIGDAAFAQVIAFTAWRKGDTFAKPESFPVGLCRVLKL